MNKFYPLATLLSAILTLGAQAQTYTTVRDGNWHDVGAAQVWDPSGEPPTNCIGCVITISKNVTLNAHVQLSGGSVLYVDGNSAKLTIAAPSGGADWASSFNVILPDDNSNPANMVSVINGGVVDATNGDNQYDGFFSSDIGSPRLYFKQLGNGASAYKDLAVINSRLVTTQTMSSGSQLKASGTLPLGLTDFDAVPNNGEVDLTWNTQFEQNSDHFDIERSSNNGAKWDVIGKVSAQGNASSVTKYDFTDANPGGGTLQYRVHGYDKDGKSTYSPIKTVRLTALATVSVFPNPAKDYVNVSLPAGEANGGQTSIRLIGQTGQLLAEKRVSNAAGTIVTFPVASYAPGNYLVQIVTADGAKQISKVLISRQ